jgi:hypothetical protein
MPRRRSYLPHKIILIFFFLSLRLIFEYNNNSKEHEVGKARAREAKSPSPGRYLAVPPSLAHDVWYFHHSRSTLDIIFQTPSSPAWTAAALA